MSGKHAGDSGIDEAWVREAAKLVGLEIASDHLPRVVANLQRIAQLAQTVNEVPLTAQDEPAPVWKP